MSDEPDSLKDAERTQVRVQLVAFYEKHNPKKLEKIDRMLEIATQQQLAIAIFNEYGCVPEGWLNPPRPSFIRSFVVGVASIIAIAIIFCAAMNMKAPDAAILPASTHTQKSAVRSEGFEVDARDLPKLQKPAVVPATTFPIIGTGATAFGTGEYSNPKSGTPLEMVKGQKLRIMVKRHSNNGRSLKSFDGIPGGLIHQKSIQVQIDNEVCNQN
jgi:hypothetical protein